MCASTIVEGCQAGGLGHLLQYMGEYNAGAQNRTEKVYDPAEEYYSLNN